MKKKILPKSLSSVYLYEQCNWWLSTYIWACTPDRLGNCCPMIIVKG